MKVTQLALLFSTLALAAIPVISADSVPVASIVSSEGGSSGGNPTSSSRSSSATPSSTNSSSSASTPSSTSESENNSSSSSGSGSGSDSSNGYLYTTLVIEIPIPTGSNTPRISQQSSSAFQNMKAQGLTVFAVAAMGAVAENRDIDAAYERDLLILYATETGNALDVAEQLAREAQRRLFSVRLISTDAYPLEDLVHETLVVFVVSTAGSGQEPRPMTAMWNMLLRADLPTDIFEDLDFAVFGLGDTAYEKYCWAAKKLSRRLQSLGAREICVRGEGDEQHSLGIVGALDAWTPLVFGALEEQAPPPLGATFEDVNALPPPRITIASSSGTVSTATESSYLKQPNGYHHVTVRCNDRMTAQDWYQDVRHIELDLEEDISYAPGDVAIIHPILPVATVESFLQSVGWSDIADEEFHFSQTYGSLPVPDAIPRRTTLRRLFTNYLDIECVPRRSFFRLLRHFARDDLESEKLAEFCSPEGGADEIYDYVTRVRRTTREVLAEFRSVQIPKEYIFDLFQLLRPRQFSIASSACVHRRQLHLCVAIVRYKTKIKIERRGVCTTYLASLKPGDALHIGIQKGFLSLPEGMKTPVVCIGPGTGVAPMRALINQRVYDGAEDNTLYFGCRSISKDHHYGSEWKALIDNYKLTYRPAFSRDGPEGVKRTGTERRLGVYLRVVQQDAYRSERRN
ncbi:hypothetical protein EW145_g7039 [Phellinidium pouzarii]|uniref:NADPH-dependent diflavin oxidoreductase 1 n=1 Tax=Phellinidium pouzarii TaxID=167371 RepID=A0A4S4KQP4_9AGAM|nr:hypothetical protein EW145_g7039 [Phellinidium pouzarii]